MNNIRELIERSRRGIKFVGKSRKKIAELISQSANETGASRVIKLIALLELMATSEEYEILASTGFTETVNSDDFERFNKVYKISGEELHVSSEAGGSRRFGRLDSDRFLSLFQETDQEDFRGVLE